MAVLSVAVQCDGEALQAAHCHLAVCGAGCAEMEAVCQGQEATGQRQAKRQRHAQEVRTSDARGERLGLLNHVPCPANSFLFALVMRRQAAEWSQVQ